MADTGDTAIRSMFRDPDFRKLSPENQADATRKVLASHDSDFARLGESEQRLTTTKILNSYGLGARGEVAGAGAKATGIQKPLPRYAEIGEDYVLPAILGTAGAAIGGAAGTMAAPGPGTMAGGAAGAGAGLVASDLLSAEINKHFFGREPDLSMANVLPNEAVNFAIGATSEAVPVGAIASRAIGAEPLAVGARAAAQEATQATERFGERQAAVGAESAAQRATASSEVAQSLGPEAKKQVIGRALGRTPEQGVAARAAPAVGGLPSPAAVGRQTGFYDTVFGPLHRASDALGAKYEGLFGKVKGQSLKDYSPLGDSITNTEQFATDNNFTYSKPTRDLIAGAKADIGPQKVGALAQSAEQISAAEGEATRPGATRPPISVVDSARAKRELSDHLFASAGQQQKAAGPATVQQLLTRRSEAGMIIRSSASSRDKAAAFQIISGIDDTLEQSGLVDQKQLSAVNRQYRSYKQTFDTNFRRKIATSIEPTDVAGDIFEQPQRFQQIAGGSTPQELSNLRRTYADWVNREGYKKLGDPDQAPVLRKLFPGTALSDPKNWIHLDDKATTALQVMQASPEMRTAYKDALHSRLAEIQRNASAEAVQYGLREGPKLGPDGVALAKTLRGIKDPNQGAQLVMDFFKKHPDQAPIQALMEGRTPPPGSFVQRAKRGLSWYPELLAATTLMGHPSYFAGAAMGAGGIVGLHIMSQKALKYALENPETAQMFWNAVSNPSSRGSIRTLGRLAADGLKADAATQIQGALGTRIATQQPQPDQTP